MLLLLTAGSAGAAGPPDGPGAAGAGGPARAECRTTVTGSTVTARCYNAGPYADAVQLHIECARWWDPDVDGMRTRLDPAESGVLSDRCWFGVARAWVSHERIRDVPDDSRAGGRGPAGGPDGRQPPLSDGSGMQP
ncbi:hypothetical protein GCM10009802_67500 [Streptomyces synnematoformans]|uniref:Secreted protein n=1 Tax=Streptomyces synnematoformans TaxID=415721 RepID=A0ABN2ADU6_9ACTN